MTATASPRAGGSCSAAWTCRTGRGSLAMLHHVGDALNLIGPNRLPDRLNAAGLADATVERGGRSMRFRARKPAG